MNDTMKSLSLLDLEWHILESVIHDCCENGLGEAELEHQMIRTQEAFYALDALLRAPEKEATE